MVVFKIVLSRDEELCRVWSGTRNGELCDGTLRAGDTRPGVVVCRRDMAEAARCVGGLRTVRLCDDENDMRAVWREFDRKPGLNSSMSSSVILFSGSSPFSSEFRIKRYDSALNQVS